jgi:hypothetical protein
LSNPMHIKRKIRGLIDDCIYSLYVITYMLWKKLRSAAG